MPHFLKPVSTVRHSMDLRLKHRRQLLWNSSTHTRGYYRFQPDINRSPLKELHSGVSRRHQIIIGRLRMGVCTTNVLLASYNLIESPNCPHCPQVPETVEHLLYICPHAEPAREPLRRLIVNDLKLPFNLRTLVGLEGVNPLDRRAVVKALCAFLASSGLDQIFFRKHAVVEESADFGAFG
jgi:hypothetical protein